MMKLCINKEQKPDIHSLSFFLEDECKFKGSVDFSAVRKSFAELEASLGKKDGNKADGLLSDFGKTLYRCLCDTGLENPFKEALQGAASEKKYLPFEIKTDDRNLDAIPFELLHDGEKYLSDSSNILILKSPLDGGKPKAVEPGSSQLSLVRVLFVISKMGQGADDLASVQEAEGEKILNAFHGYLEEGKFEVDFLVNPSLSKIKYFLSANDYNLVHFYGEGGIDEKKSEGFIVLSDEKNSRPEKIYADDFKKVFGSSDPDVHLLLSLDAGNASGSPYACHGGSAPLNLFVRELLDAKTLASVAILPGFQGAEKNHRFLETFYKTLLNGKGVDFALYACRQSLAESEKDLKAFSPLIFTRELRPLLKDGDVKKAVDEEKADPVLNLSNLPVVGNRFVGKHGLLKALGNIYATHSKRCVVLHGPDGIGKSCLAVKSAMENGGKFKGVTNVKFDERTSFTQVQDSLANFINYIEQGKFCEGFYKDVKNSDRKVDEIFTEFTRNPYLIVFDNFDTQVADGKIKNEELEKFVTGFINVIKEDSVLLITTGKKIKFDEKLSKNIGEFQAGPASLTETISYMNFFEDFRPLKLDEKMLVYEVTGGNPLLLFLSINLLRMGNMTISELLKDFKPEGEDEFRAFLMNEIYSRLPEKARDVADSAWVFSDEAQFDFYVDLFGLKDQKEIMALNKSLQELSDWGILASCDGCFQIHPTVRLFLKEKNADKEKDLLKKAGIIYYSFSKNNPDDIWYHVKASDYFLDAGENQPAAEVISEVVELVDSKGLWEYAIRLCERFSEVTEGQLKEYFISCLARISLDRNLLDDSEEYYKELLASNDEKRKAHICHQLGTIAEMKKEFKEAIDYYEQSLGIKKENGDKFGEAQTLHQLGILFETREEYDKALESYQRSMEIRKEIKDTRGRIYSFGQLGLFYLHRADFKKAVQYTFEGIKLAHEEGEAEVGKVVEQMYELREMEEEEKFYEVLKELGVEDEFCELIGYI